MVTWKRIGLIDAVWISIPKRLTFHHIQRPENHLASALRTGDGSSSRLPASGFISSRGAPRPRGGAHVRGLNERSKTKTQPLCLWRWAPCSAARIIYLYSGSHRRC